MKSFFGTIVSIIGLFVVGNAYAGNGYICMSDIKKYVSCASGSYLSNGSCIECPAYNTIWEDFNEKYPEAGIDDFIQEGWGSAQNWDDEFGRVLWDASDQTLSVSDDLTQCRFSIYASVGIENGSITAEGGADYPDFLCGVVDTAAAANATGVEMGKYACLVWGADEIACGAGYVLDDVCFNEDSDLCNVHDALRDDGTSVDYDTYGNIFVVKKISGLKCVQSNAGYYSAEGEIFGHLCQDTTVTNDDGEPAARGQYCPAGSGEPGLCPEATEAVDLEGNPVAGVYGITGMEGAESISDCHLPASDKVYYKDSIGIYQLEDSCDYMEVNHGPVDPGIGGDVSIAE